MDVKRHPTSFLNGVNATFVAELYSQYLSDPGSVDPEWTAFFVSLGDDSATLSQEMRGASWAPSQARVIGVMDGRGGAVEATAVEEPWAGRLLERLTRRHPGLGHRIAEAREKSRAWMEGNN